MKLITELNDEKLAESFKRRAVDEDWAAELLDVIYDSLRAALEERDSFRDGMARLATERIAALAEKHELRHKLEVADDIEAAYQREEKRMLAERDAALARAEEAESELCAARDLFHAFRYGGPVGDRKMKAWDIAAEIEGNLSPCRHKEEVKLLREAVEWALENGDEVNISNDPSTWKAELRRRVGGGG